MEGSTSQLEAVPVRGRTHAHDAAQRRAKLEGSPFSNAAGSHRWRAASSPMRLMKQKLKLPG